MRKNGIVRVVRRNKKEEGFTLLEYASGAAVILGVVWVAMGQLGTSYSNVIDSIAGWTDKRAGEIDAQAK